MKLTDVVEIQPGTVLARVKSKGYEESVSLPIVGLDDIRCFVERKEPVSERRKYSFPKDAVDSLITAKTNDVIFGMSSSKCLLVDSKLEGFVIPSILCRLRPYDSNRLNPSYLCFLLNEKETIRKPLEIAHQGTILTVKVVSVGALRDLEIGDLPDIERQRKIGDLYLSALKSYELSQRISEKTRELTIRLMQKD